MALGYRSPFTYKKTGPLEGSRVIMHSLNLKLLFEENRVEEQMQYIHELMQGKDPRFSEWFKNVKVERS